MESVRFVGIDVHKYAIQLAVLSDRRQGREIEFEALGGTEPRPRSEEGDKTDTPGTSRGGRVRNGMPGSDAGPWRTQCRGDRRVAHGARVSGCMYHRR